MKKFLLLLVGVLFALSAKADYYLVGQMNEWKTNETYKFQAVGDGTYKLVVPGAITAGQPYKICAGMIDENNVNWEVNIGAWENNYQLSYNSPYGAKNASDSQNFQWEEDATYPIIYLSNFVNDNGTNKVTITVYKNEEFEESSVYISGNFSGAEWVEPGKNGIFKFTYDVGGVYTLDLSDTSYSLTGNRQFKIYKDANGWEGGTQYSTNGQDLKVGTPYKASTGGSNITVAKEVTNPVITFDAITQYITITDESATPDPTPTTYYYRLHGQIFAEGDSWKTQAVMKDNEDGTYSFEATNLTIGSFGIKELPSATTETNTAWIRAAKGTGTISRANTPYAVAYENGDNDGGSDLSSTLTGNYTIVFDKKNMTITFKKASTPDPGVNTAYTIYFDAVRSGSAWANPHLTLGGVEVIGVADGSLIKYAFNAVAGAEIAFSNGSTTSDPVALENNTVYYVDNNKITSDSKTGYKYSPTHEYTYRVHGQIGGNKDWGNIEMTYYPDGTWRTAATKFVAGRFGIQKLDQDGNQYTGPDNNNDEYGWISCSSTSNNNMSLGVKSVGVIKAGNSVQDWAIAADSELAKKEYVLVFDPEAKTVMFINPAVAATATATVDPVSTTSHANKLSVTIKVRDYSSVTGGYALSNGTFTAVSTDGNFTNVPYASNYTLTVGSTSMPINIALPAEPEFKISKAIPTVFAPVAGQANGILSVAFTVSTDWAYNLPHVICTYNGAVVPGEVEWSTNGFTFSAANVVPIITTETGYAVKDKMTFNFVITPEYPFMVNAASTRGQMRVSGTGYQNVLGTAVAAVATFNGGSEVSGVEGVMIEDEEAPVEYFNLQGQRVNGELAPGIYIRRQGSSVTKVRF